METRTVCELYALKCPDSGDVRYLGKAVDSTKRFKSHMRDCLRRDTPVYRWIRKLRGAGKAPQLQVLMPTWDWPTAERQLIAQAKADGLRLLNVAEGGTEPFCSTQQRAANGRANALAVHSDAKRKRFWEIKQRLGIALKRGHLAERTKEKMRDAAIKRPDLFGEWASI